MLFVNAWVGPEQIRKLTIDLVTSGPSREHQAVETYVNQVRNALAWERSPTIYKTSATYFERHFAALRPDQPHPFPRVDRQPFLSIGDLMQMGPAATGAPIFVAGNLYGTPTMIEPTSERTASVAFTLKDPRVERTAVVCRAPVRAPIDFADRDRVTVSGVLIADGAIRRADGRGFDRVLYLACNSITHSTNITLVAAKPRAK